MCIVLHRELKVGVSNMATDKLTDLEYCVRMKHCDDMPLQGPRKNCAFKGAAWKKRDSTGVHHEEECEFYPAHLRYCEANGIDLKNNFSIRFRCVLHKPQAVA